MYLQSRRSRKRARRSEAQRPDEVPIQAASPAERSRVVRPRSGSPISEGRNRHGGGRRASSRLQYPTLAFGHRPPSISATEPSRARSLLRQRVCQILRGKLARGRPSGPTTNIGASRSSLRKQIDHVQARSEARAFTRILARGFRHKNGLIRIASRMDEWKEPFRLESRIAVGSSVAITIGDLDSRLRLA